MYEVVLFDGPSTVVSVSNKRLFTGALRRAIEVRDRHCQHPSGCDEPADRCDVDHIVPASRGGPTSQGNGRLECKVHNRNPVKHDHGALPRPDRHHHPARRDPRPPAMAVPPRSRRRRRGCRRHRRRAGRSRQRVMGCGGFVVRRGRSVSDTSRTVVLPVRLSWRVFEMCLTPLRPSATTGPRWGRRRWRGRGGRTACRGSGRGAGRCPAARPRARARRGSRGRAPGRRRTRTPTRSR